MKVLAINGSPRAKGNTDIVLEWTLDELRAKGAKVEKVMAARRKISGCVECFACQKDKDTPGCAVKDDMQALYGKILKADLIILASPVFCWGITAQIKAILDRCYAFFKFNQEPYVCLMAGKKMALVITAGGGLDDGPKACEAQYLAFGEFAGVENAGVLLVPNAKGPEETNKDADLKQRAAKFGQRLAKSIKD
ncbi:MAG TPA: flavodoxin family protein [Candidatus Brocadiia bacterium]|nr:flavodoxin family protein [Candidatus Brocadiia bacterium]